jgi:polysaccharide transporter, PST family
MFWLYSLQGLNYLVPLAVLPYLIRVLGVERYGLIAFAQAFAQYFVIVTDYGFNLSATRRIALIRDDREEVSRLYWSVILIKLGLMLLGAIVVASLLAVVPRFHANASLYAIAYIAVLGNVLFPVWLFQGMEQMRYISIVSGGAKVLSAVLLFVLVHRESDFLLAVAIQSGGILVAGIAGFSIGLARFQLSFHWPSRFELAQTLRDGWHLFVSNAAGTLYATSNVFLVGLIAGNVQAGYFSVAERVTRSLQGMLGPVTQAIYPYVSGLAARSREAAVEFLRKSLAWIGLLSFVPSVLLLLFAHPVAIVLAGEAANGSVTPLRWMAMLPFIISVSSVLAIQTMIPFGMENRLSRIYVIAGLSSLLVSLPLIHRFGASGGGAAVLAVEVCIVLAMWNALKKNGIELWLRPTATPRPQTQNEVPQDACATR